MNTIDQLLPVDQFLAGLNGNSTTLPLQLISPPQPQYDATLPIPNCTPPLVEVPKVVREYPLPGARQTHETVVVVGENMLVLSQQTNSTLIKVVLDPSTGRPQSCSLFLVWDFWAGLHGLAASQIYPGHVWATLQFRSLLIRINVGLNKVEQVIRVPPPLFGPHCIYECGNDLWTSCKDSSHVLRINHTDPTCHDYSSYPCSPRPIFIAIHPTSKDVYASLDISSKIWRLDQSTGKTSELDIPPSRGTTPVGLVAGPDGNVWFTLLGGASGGTGTFACISPTGEFKWFSLSTPLGARAGLIHLAFQHHQPRPFLPPGPENHILPGRTKPPGLRIWLLSSSMVAEMGIDAVITVVIDVDVGHIITQHTIALPTQSCCAHRLIPHDTGLFVTQLSISSLAHVAGATVVRPTFVAGEDIDVDGETTDVYGDFGVGQRLSRYNFTEDYPRLPCPPGRLTKPNGQDSSTHQVKGGKRLISTTAST